MGHFKRIRDPVHGLIIFDLEDRDSEVDKAAWRLIDTPEFQRLRRVKQLGVSEFTFPGATHTRFSHSIGVFHVARQLMKIAKKQCGDWNHSKARVALIAALLHDIGHGPFSHAFEIAEKARLKEQPSHYQDHEHWTAEIISSERHGVRKVLKEMFGANGAIADDVATLLTTDPTDIYAAVVSSSFDADRLDYLQRDRLMTGSGAGAIDFQWLLDNLRVVQVPSVIEEGESAVEPGRSENPEQIETFAFEEKALQAVEAFILARYHLYSQVYLHHATRGMEQMISKFLFGFANEAKRGVAANLAVHEDHPLRAYYAEEPNIRRYLDLDDAVVWSAVEITAERGNGALMDQAKRIRDRKLMKSIAIEMQNPTATDKARRRFIETELLPKMENSIFVDRAPLSIYKDAQRENVKPHKRVYIKRKHEEPVDVARLSKPVQALAAGEEILRYYFLDESARNLVLKITGERDDETR
jgi:HD superfamily phosphohydrolase